MANLLINGEPCGEIGLNAAVAGYFNAPVILISGDQAACSEAEALIPGIEQAVVKWANGRMSAELLPPSITQEKIRIAASQAVHQFKHDQLPAPRKLETPIQMAIDFVHSEMADKAAILPGASRTGRRIEYTAPDVPTLYRAFRSAVMMVRVDSMAAFDQMAPDNGIKNNPLPTGRQSSPGFSRTFSDNQDDPYPWGICSRPVSDMSREPRSLSERVNQALIGDAVQVLDETEDWLLVRLAHDGYTGWIRTGAIHSCSQQEAKAYQSACRTMVQADLLQAWFQPIAIPGQEAGRLPFGVCVPVEEQHSSAAQVRLPDGRTWWVDRSGLLSEDFWPFPSPSGIAFALGLIRRFIGIPYLWGGAALTALIARGWRRGFGLFLERACHAMPTSSSR